MILIEVKNLVKRYGDRDVVDNLSFTVGKGQIVGFLGPNGAGKSTTMNIITGYISATSGTAVVGGYDVFDEPEKAKACIGYLPEQPPLYPDMRAREYLDFVADLKKVKKSEKAKMMDDIMKMTQITDVSERLIKHLSKGYKQRVGLAGAIMGYPDILILDEPTVGLDPMQIIEMRKLIVDLSKNHTILLSSHIMQEVSAVCNQIMIINQGRLIVSDTPDKITNAIDKSNELSLLIKGNKALIKSTLEGLEEIQKFDIDKMEGNASSMEGNASSTVETEESASFAEHYNVLITTKENKDVREAVFFAFANNKLPILEMNTKKTSLEEVFLRMTEGGTKQYGGKKEGGKNDSSI